jgi:two-component system, LytTR family, response regulator
MIRCIIVDDSPLALDLLENYITKIPELHLVKRCTNALEAIETLRKCKTDLLFLDIQMPDITGIDLLNSLDCKPKVIFTTAFPNYAVEGFNLNASDYLLKPFSFERFNTAVQKVKLQIELEKAKTISDESIFVKSGYDTVKIRCSDILYIEALKDYILIFAKDKKVITLMGMKDILEILPKNDFVRTQRSYIVSLDKITRISPRKVFIGEIEIPIGEIFKDEFLTAIKKKKTNS